MKKIIAICFTVILAVFSALPVFALTDADEGFTSPFSYAEGYDGYIQPAPSDSYDWTYYRSLRQIPSKTLSPLLVDNGNLLTSSEQAHVLSVLSEKSEELNVSIAVLTQYSLGQYSPEVYADDFYDYNGYGKGENRDGILLLVSMEYRDYHITTCGSCVDLFGEAEFEELDDAFLSYLGDGDYCEAFEAFASEVETIILNGGAVKAHKNALKVFLICLVVCSAVSTVIVILISKSSSKPVRYASNAADYHVPGGLNLTNTRDIFLYKNVTKHYNPPSDSSSGGSGHSHTSSSGSSHGGHGGKF
ncbi:MAG: TPM domain-containing protein [Clostridiales bacterium]|nr:TPM domain-containing protein [Clostridiales bacterium]